MSLNVLIIDIDGLSLSFAWRCVQAGHAVRWFVKPGDEVNVDTGLGFRGIEKITNWVSSIKWADLVLLTGNSEYVERLDAFKKRGVPVFAPSVASAKLEIDRKAGMEFMEKIGIEVAPYVTVKSIDEAIKMVKKTEERYVIKTLGDCEDKSLTYVSKSPADMVETLNRWKLEGINPKGDLMLQTFIKGIEVGVSRFMGRDGWVGQWNVSHEFKKMMSGDYGPNCYSADTEVLTDGGWKYWPDVAENDKICTLIDNKIEFEIPSRLTVADVDEDLIAWSSPTVDIMVTSGHNMYVQDDHYRKPFYFEPAEVTSKNKRTIRRGGGVWQGLDELEKLPTCARSAMPEFSALIGIYIADGNCKERSIVFGNCPAHKQKIFIEIADAAGFSAKMYGSDLYINSADLSNYMRSFGKAGDKFCPEFIKNGSSETIQAFLYGYGAGDGCINGSTIIYTTVSKKLADDIQELLLKVGKYGAIAARDRRGESHEINGYTCENKMIAYDICENSVRLKANLSPDICSKVPYKGKVYCCTVTSHIIYVRRNGKACWLGQTGEQGTIAYFTKNEKLAEETLAKAEKGLIELGHIGDSAIGFIITEEGKYYPTEWTLRPGWPCAQLFLGATEGDPVEWMIDALNGKDTTSFKEDIGCILVMGHKGFPIQKNTIKEVSGYPIYGITKGNKKHIHPYGIQIKPMLDDQDGKIVERPMWNTSEGAVLSVTGFGKDVKQATERAYKTTGQLHVANMMLRDDVGDKLEEELPKLHKLGFCLHCDYEKEIKK